MKSLLIASITLLVAGSASASSASLSVSSSTNAFVVAVPISEVGYLETSTSYSVVIYGNTGTSDVSCKLTYPFANETQGITMLNAIQQIAGNQKYVVTCVAPTETNISGGRSVQLDMTQNNYTFGIAELF